MTSIYTTATQLAACLCAQLVTDNIDDDVDLGHMCFCGVIGGQQAVHDFFPTCDDKDGFAWVRLGLGYPAKTPGVADQNPDNCNLSLGFDLEVGVVRTFTCDAEGYSAADHAEMARISTHDLYTMVRAIRCCDAIESPDMVLGQYTPIGPSAFIYGGSWELHVQVL